MIDSLQTGVMGRLLSIALLFTSAAFLFRCQPSVAQQAHPVSSHRLTVGQAREIAALVARQDHINLRDTHVELNSMDLQANFIPGYASFVVIQESPTPGPDEILRRYAVNRRTGDVWEMTLCTRYDFPALTRMRGAFAVRTPTAADEIAAQRRELGCSEEKPAPSS
jgi:hypothetical protein